jgi:hypothetical protein
LSAEGCRLKTVLGSLDTDNLLVILLLLQEKAIPSSTQSSIVLKRNFKLIIGLLNN